MGSDLRALADGNRAAGGQRGAPAADEPVPPRHLVGGGVEGACKTGRSGAGGGVGVGGRDRRRASQCCTLRVSVVTLKFRSPPEQLCSGGRRAAQPCWRIISHPPRRRRLRGGRAPCWQRGRRARVVTTLPAGSGRQTLPALPAQRCRRRRGGVEVADEKKATGAVGRGGGRGGRRWQGAGAPFATPPSLPDHFRLPPRRTRRWLRGAAHRRRHRRSSFNLESCRLATAPPPLARLRRVGVSSGPTSRRSARHHERPPEGGRGTASSPPPGATPHPPPWHPRGGGVGWGGCLRPVFMDERGRGLGTERPALTATSPVARGPVL